MGKFDDFNKLAFVLDREKTRYEDAKKRRVEELAEVNRKYNKIESDYLTWFDECLPKYKELARDVYLASTFKLVDVAYVAADIISAFSGEEYTFQRAKIVDYVGSQKNKKEKEIDAIIASDSLALEYSSLELVALERDKKMIVLTDKHMDKDAEFRFYESDADGILTFTNRFNRFECVLNFFKMVIADNADIRPDIPYTYEYLVKLKNEYLLENFDKISSRCDTVDSEDKKEYNETIDKALLKLNVKKEFRAKMLTKIREFRSGDSETNS